MTDRPVLLVSTPIEAALSKLAEEADWLDELKQPGGVVMRRCVREVRAGMKAAEELWVTLTEAARISGWSEPTISKYCAMLAEGETVPLEWANMEARRAGTGFRVRPSTVPPKPARRKAG